MHKTPAVLIVTLLTVLWAPGALDGFESPAPAAVRVDPPFCDRLFPYVRYQSVWQDTPAGRSDVMVPNLICVYGTGEGREIVAEAARIAFYLGNWTEDIGFAAEDFQNNRMPDILVSDKDVAPTGSFSIIVIGKNNRWVRKHKIAFGGPSVLGRAHDGRTLLYVGGEAPEGTLAAVRYLADNRLNFKSGAYKTFFNLIRVRGYLEEENWAAARITIHSPGGLSACGRNMAVASRTLRSAPEKLREQIRHRNMLLYKELPRAVQEEDKERTRNKWMEAMATCYGCHQGLGQIPRLRAYQPLESIHSKHHRMAQEFPSLNHCGACHHGPTEMRGYKESRRAGK